VTEILPKYRQLGGASRIAERVLLAAVAIHRVGYGLALIAAFSLGLATALMIVGILALRARDAVQRRLSHRTARLVPVLSATAIVVLGLVLTVSGATQL